MNSHAHTDTPPTYRDSLLYSRATRYPRPRTRDPPTTPTLPLYRGFNAENQRYPSFSGAERRQLAHQRTSGGDPR